MCKSFGIFFYLHFATFAFLCGEVVVGATAILSADALDDIDRCNFCHSVKCWLGVKHKSCAGLREPFEMRSRPRASHLEISGAKVRRKISEKNKNGKKVRFLFTRFSEKLFFHEMTTMQCANIVTDTMLLSYTSKGSYWELRS